jgi:hypothetical protein
MTELNMGANDTVRRIKIRNLQCQIRKMQADSYTAKEWCDEDRDWYAGEKEEIIEELQKVIKILSS